MRSLVQQPLKILLLMGLLAPNVLTFVRADEPEQVSDDNWPLPADDDSARAAEEDVLPGAPVQPYAPVRPQAWPGIPAPGSSEVIPAGYLFEGPPTDGSSAMPPRPAPQGVPASPYPVTRFPEPNSLPVETRPPAPQEPSRPIAPSGNLPPVNAPDGVQSFESGQTIARVGSEIVLASEVPGIAILQQNADKIPPAKAAEYWKSVRMQLKNIVDTKLVYSDFRRTAPPEGVEQVEKNVGEQFDKTQIKSLMKKTSTTSRAELEARLRDAGSSLQQQRRAFIERAIASSWSQQQIKREEEITHEDMLGYYHEHAADYAVPAKARFEQLTIRKDRYPSPEDAYRDVANCGNEILRGAPFAEIAKARSHAPTAREGGLNDWTSQGTLVSEAVDQAIFGLPVGRMSQILEDDTSFHIVRVIERSDAGRTSFVEAQVEIKKKIGEERHKKQLEDYLAKLRKDTAVWTIFDQPAGETSGVAGNTEFGTNVDRLR